VPDSSSRQGHSGRCTNSAATALPDRSRALQMEDGLWPGDPPRRGVRWRRPATHRSARRRTPGPGPILRPGHSAGRWTTPSNCRGETRVAGGLSARSASGFPDPG
jgi:hypothetical protein